MSSRSLGHRNTKTPPRAPVSTEQVLREAFALQQTGRLAEAELRFLAVLKREPSNGDALSGMGIVTSMAGNQPKALEYLRKAVRIDPRNGYFLNNLGKVLVRMHEPEEAIPVLLDAVEYQPDLYEALSNLGSAYRSVGRPEKGIPYLRRAVELEPSRPAALLELADSLVASGETEEPRRIFQSLLPTKQAHRALRGLAASRKHTAEDNDLELIRSFLLHAGEERPKRKALNYAAGKVCLDMKRYDEAFAYFAASHADSEGASVARFKEQVERICALYTADFLESKRGLGIDDERPVFIVGMPRSGTTLTEQIIASHPDAYGAGELPHLGRLVTAVFGGASGTPLDGIRKIDREQARRFADEYMRRLLWYSQSARRITDKMPHNFQQLGLISIVFPNAKIIHCRRNPIDNCVSIHTQQFNERHDYGARLRGMGEYYREYDRLMQHWKSVLPIPIHEVQYEEMVADQEAQSRKLLDFVGLDWDPAVLEFYKSERAVTTPSRLQVRQPIYKTSVKRWKEYEPHIGELIEGLGDLADRD